MNGPSYVVIDEFTVQRDGTLSYQLTPNNTAGGPTGGDYPQVNADTANLDGTLSAQFLPGFYQDKTTYEAIISADTLNGRFAWVKDNSVLLNTRAVYDGGTVDLTVTRSPFDKVSDLRV